MRGPARDKLDRVVARALESRAALARMVADDEVAAAVPAMLAMPGLCAADIDLSAGMVAR